MSGHYKQVFVNVAGMLADWRTFNSNSRVWYDVAVQWSMEDLRDLLRELLPQKPQALSPAGVSLDACNNVLGRSFEHAQLQKVSGVTGLLVGHPFDTVKARLQTDGLDGRKLYRGTIHCVVHIAKREGPKAFYKGMAAPLVGMAAINALVFGIQGNMMKHLQSGSETLKLRNSCFSGAVAGWAQSFIICPIELIKLRMQFQKDPTPFFGTVTTKTKMVYSNPVEAVKKIYSKDGFRGLSKGLVPTLWREIPAFAVYFSSYDFICQWMVERKTGMTLDELSPVSLCIAGGLGGIAAWAVTYPIDVVKSRIQVDGMVGVTKYHGMIDCFTKCYSESRDIRVFFRGFNSTMLRAFPVNAVTFTTVALLLRQWRLKKQD